jgi:hypothetical protein
MDTDDLGARIDGIAASVRRATLPLFKPDGRREPTLVGCSVAVSHGDDFFLLTARHVVVDLKMTDFHVWTPGAWIVASGRVARTDPDGRKPDRLDAAVIHLDGSVVNEHLRANALSIDDLDHAPVLQPDQVMMLVGYPGGEVQVPAKNTVSPTYFQWVGPSASYPAYARRGRSEKTHALFEFDRAQAVHNTKGRHPGPDMHGASGSGIWRLLPDSEGLKRRRLALVTAIFTDYEGRAIIGTRVGVHLALVAKYFA